MYVNILFYIKPWIYKIQKIKQHGKISTRKF